MEASGTPNSNTTSISTVGNVVTITGPFGQQTKIGLDANKYATYIDDPKGGHTTVSHDANGLLMSLTDRNNKQHTFAYDGLGRLKKDADLSAGYQLLARTPQTNGYVVSRTTALGAKSSYSYSLNSSGLESRTVTLTDGSQNVSSESPANPTSGGVVSTTTLADGRTITATQTVDNLWPSLPFTKELKASFAGGPEIKFTNARITSYVNNQLDTVTDTTKINAYSSPWTTQFKVSTKTFTFTTPVGSVSPVGRQNQLTVDDFGRPVTITPPVGLTNSDFFYDHGRLTKMSQGNRQTELFYLPSTDATAPGKLKEVRVTNGAGSVSAITFPDGLGQPVTSSLGATSGTPASIQTGFSWDGEGNMSSVIVPGSGTTAQRTHSQTFNTTSLLASYTPPPVGGPADSKTSLFYNFDGSLDLVQKPGGVYNDYVYEQSTGKLADDGYTQFAYYPTDATCLSSSGCTKGFVKTAQTYNSTSNNTLSFTYTSALPKGETLAWSNGSVTITKAFNADLRLETETVGASVGSSSTTATYRYDVDGLMTCATVTSPAGANCTNDTKALRIGYDATTGLIKNTEIGIVNDGYAWNSFGEGSSYIAKINSTPVYSVVYDDLSTNARDGFGRIKRETDSLSGAKDYEYDNQGRLWKFSQGGAVVRQYEYDQNGNRLSIAPGGGPAIATYDSQDRLTSYDFGSGFRSYSYWPNGEVKRKPRADGSFDEFAYDSFGRIASVQLGSGGSVAYSYDGLGRRVQRIVSLPGQSTVTTRYVYRDATNIAAVLDGSGAVLSRFVYSTKVNVPDYMVLSNGKIYRIISDQRGSPRLVVDTTAPGTVAGQFDFDEFGNRTVAVPVSAFEARAMPFGFAGGLHDEDSKLVHFGARDYDAGTGRWLRKDPIYFAGGQTNLYVYTGNDPVNRIDPSGRYWWIIGTAAVGAGLDLYWQLSQNGGNWACVDWADVGTSALVGAAAGTGMEFLVGTAFSGLATSEGLVAVTQWGGGASPWVMLGGNNVRNWLLAGGPEIAPMSTGVTQFVDQPRLAYPAGLEAAKGLLGQRILSP